ncbi:MAG: BatA and WFA domain-containing protein, partial [Thermoguttaceae bacterium]|nr:BatA and WFA domain-containing protein [Thermoguttaceae bacterium]
MRPKPKKLTFPAFRFLQSHEKSQRRSLRLKHWLLLLARMLIIVLAVLLFAQPGFISRSKTPTPQKSGSGQAAYSSAPTAAVFLFDSSVRMDYVFQNRTRLKAAQDQAAQILAALPPQSVASVVSTHLAPLAFSPDRGEILRQIEQLETSASARSIPEVLPEAAALLETSELEQKEIFIFTDLTARSWEIGGAARRQALHEALKKVPNARISVVNVGVEAPVNCRLEVPTEKSFQTVAGGATEIHAALWVSDAQPHRVGIFLMDESGKLQLRGETSVSASSPMESGKETALPFTFSLGALKNGSNQGFLVLLDGDALAADNSRAFTIQKDPPTPVLLIANEPAEKNAFLVRQALAPMQFTLENRAKFECSVLSFPQFLRWLGGGTGTSAGAAGSSGTLRNLERFHAIFLLDPPGFGASEWNRLAQYVHSGGGLALFLGSALKNPADFQLAEARQILPAVPGFQARFQEGTFPRPQIGAAHPILKTFQTLGTPIPWEDSQVFRAWTLTDSAPVAQELFTWSNGSPALLAQTRGAGRVVLLGTPVNSAGGDSREIWNLLAQGDSWVFLVTMNEIARFLTAVENAPGCITTHEPLTFPLRGTQEERFTLNRSVFPLPEGAQNSSEKKFNSEQTLKPQEVSVLVPDLERRQLDLPGLERAGNYTISGEKGEFERGFSVNIPLAETDLTRTTSEAVKQIFDPFGVTFLETASQMERTRSGAQSSRELFSWIGLMLLVLLGVENWLSNRFYA